jgi:hypothetical protein
MQSVQIHVKSTNSIESPWNSTKIDAPDTQFQQIHSKYLTSIQNGCHSIHLSIQSSKSELWEVGDRDGSLEIWITHMVVFDYLFRLTCIRVTAETKKLTKSYTHDILLVPHPPMPHPTVGHVGLGGWGGALRGGVLEKSNVYIYTYT